MKKIIYIELSNYVDFPLGGHLSFAKHITAAMKGEIDLVGISTSDPLPTGTWTKRVIEGFEYNYFNVRNQEACYKKSIVPARIHDYFQIKKYIKRILTSKDYDIIIIQTPEILFATPKKFLSKVCLISPGVNNPLQLSRYQWARMFAGIYDRLFFSFARKVHVILPAADSASIKGYIERSRGAIAPTMVKQFPTRYDARIFSVQSKETARQELGIHISDLLLVTSGRLNWFKGWKYMIDSFKIFAHNHNNAKLYFIGKGEDEQKIRDYIKELSLENSVILAGVHPLPVVAKYLNAADMFVMGSYFEGWSTALVEAIACANPCVVTEFSSAHDLVHDGENGFVQCERNESGFAELLEKALLLNENTINQYAKDAYSMSVQTMRNQLNNILCFE